jgi:hypothetical protein
MGAYEGQISMTPAGILALDHASISQNDFEEFVVKGQSSTSTK